MTAALPTSTAAHNWCGIVQCGMVWYDRVWYDLAWYSIVLPTSCRPQFSLMTGHNQLLPPLCSLLFCSFLTSSLVCVLLVCVILFCVLFFCILFQYYSLLLCSLCAFSSFLVCYHIPQLYFFIPSFFKHRMCVTVGNKQLFCSFMFFHILLVYFFL